jgi:hypothetical protein
VSAGVRIVDESELADGVAPLTKAELRWIHRLQAVLASCPSRLELVTIGDPGLDVIDGKVTAATSVELHDGKAASNGVVLASVHGGPVVHGVS